MTKLHPRPEQLFATVLVAMGELARTFALSQLNLNGANTNLTRLMLISLLGEHLTGYDVEGTVAILIEKFNREGVPTYEQLVDLVLEEGAK